MQDHIDAKKDLEIYLKKHRHTLEDVGHYDELIIEDIISNIKCKIDEIKEDFVFDGTLMCDEEYETIWNKRQLGVV